MVAAVQSLAFYCFPLLTGLLLHVMRQRDHDSYLLRRRDTPGQRVHRVGNRDSQHRRGGDDAPLGGRHVRGVTDGYRRSGQRRDRDRQGEPVEPGARLADPVGEERVQAEAHGRARA